MTAPHVERMQAEHDELADRLGKLTLFINEAPGFSGLAHIDRDLMRAQQQSMIGYLGILTMRLNRAAHG